MPLVLTAASALVCPHNAPVTISASQHALTVDGQPVLVAADILAGTIATCPHKNVNKGEVQCLKVLTIDDSGLSSTLTVAGQPVVLATAQGTTNSEDSAAPLGSKKWSVKSVNQSTMEVA